MHTPVRRCLACRRATARSALVRFAVVGETVTVDPPARQPGRGAYVCHERGCVEAALDRDGLMLRRSLRSRGGRVTVDEDVLFRQWCAAAGPPGRSVADATTMVASASRSVE